MDRDADLVGERPEPFSQYLRTRTQPARRAGRNDRGLLFSHARRVGGVFRGAAAVLGLQFAFGDNVTDLQRRLTHFAIATIAIAGGCSALPLTAAWPLALGFGGIIGDFVYAVVRGVVGEVAPNASGALPAYAFSRSAFGPFRGLSAWTATTLFNVRMSSHFFARSADASTAACGRALPARQWA